MISSDSLSVEIELELQNLCEKIAANYHMTCFAGRLRWIQVTKTKYRLHIRWTHLERSLTHALRSFSIFILPHALNAMFYGAKHKNFIVCARLCLLMIPMTTTIETKNN